MPRPREAGEDEPAAFCEWFYIGPMLVEFFLLGSGEADPKRLLPLLCRARVQSTEVLRHASRAPRHHQADVIGAGDGRADPVDDRLRPWLVEEVSHGDEKDEAGRAGSELRTLRARPVQRPRPVAITTRKCADLAIENRRAVLVLSLNDVGIHVLGWPTFVVRNDEARRIAKLAAASVGFAAYGGIP